MVQSVALPLRRKVQVLFAAYEQHLMFNVMWVALLVLAAAPAAAGVDLPGSAQPTPGLARALGELGVGAEAFAALPAAARGLFGLLVGEMELLRADNAELASRMHDLELAHTRTMADEMETDSQPEAGLEENARRRTCAQAAPTPSRSSRPRRSTARRRSARRSSRRRSASGARWWRWG